MKSCTQDPFSNIFTREGINLELIDTAGSSDSSNNDERNLNNLVNYLKNKKQIDYILLLLKFGERLTSETQKYLFDLGKIFTPSEFYFHLCVIFTKYPIHPKKKDRETRDLFIKEINETLKESFKLKINQELPEIDVRFIDTDIDENEEGELLYDEKSQNTVDIIIQKIKLNCEIYTSINTENLDCTGVNAQKRRDEEKRQLEEKVRKLEEEKKRKEEEQKEMERLRKLKDEENKRRYQEMLKQKEEEKKRLEQMARIEKERREQIEREKKRIEEEEKRKNILREDLDRKKDGWNGLAKVGGWGFLGSVALGVGGAVIAPFCPIAGAAMIGGALGGGTSFGAEYVGGKIGEAYYEHQKKNVK